MSPFDAMTEEGPGVAISEKFVMKIAYSFTSTVLFLTRDSGCGASE